MQTEGRKWFSTEETVRQAAIRLIFFFFCIIYGCFHQSNRETQKSFYRVSSWPLNLPLRSGGAELDNARVCGDNFVKLAFSLFLCFGGVCTSVNEQQQGFYEAKCLIRAVCWLL